MSSGRFISKLTINRNSLYRRRPRWTSSKPWTTAAILNDLARRIINRNLDTTGPPLHQDCFDFLAVLDQNDQMSNNLEESLWDVLCRMRRAKLESEFRVRGLLTQLTEADQSEQAVSKEISYKRAVITGLDKKIGELKEKKHINMINRTVQLVIKRGAIEVNLTGALSDFEDAILIAKSEVDEINNLIRRAGTKKLAAMNTSAIFRRKVLHKEWEHEGKRLFGNVWEDEMKDIEFLFQFSS